MTGDTRKRCQVPFIGNALEALRFWEMLNTHCRFKFLPLPPLPRCESPSSRFQISQAERSTNFYGITAAGNPSANPC